MRSLRMKERRVNIADSGIPLYIRVLFGRVMHTSLAGLSIIVTLLIGFSRPATGQSIQQILKLREPQKTEALHSWYFREVRQYEPVKAQLALAALETEAKRSDDRSGQAAAIYFRGQYLAVKCHDTAGIGLMKQGIAMSDDASMALQAAIFKHHLGYYYFSVHNTYSLAIRYMLEAHSGFVDIGYRNVADAAVYLNRMAFAFYHLGLYIEAMELWRSALEYTGGLKNVEVNILNSIGQCYRNLYRYPEAMQYFTRAFDSARRIKDTAWIGISAGSIGQLYILQGNHRAAKPYCEIYYNYSKQSEDTACISESLMYLAQLDLADGATNQSGARLMQADTLLQSVFRKEKQAGGVVSKEHYIRQLELLRTWAAHYGRLGENGEAMVYMQRANMVRDSLEKRSLVSGAMVVKEQVAMEKHRAAMQLLEQEKQNAMLKLYIFIALLVVVTSVLLMLYHRQKLKRKAELLMERQRESLINAEKRRMEAELSHAETLLGNYTENLRQKTELLEQVQTEIGALRTLHGDDQSPQVLYLNTLANSSILTEADWDNFSHLFDKVHRGFLVKLKEKYPQLTPAEVRLLSLTRLKLSTKEMASMLGVCTETIKKTRQRVRKKIEIPEDHSLDELVAAI